MVEGLGFSQNGRQLVSFIYDGTLGLLDSETGNEIEAVESGGNLWFPSHVTSQVNQMSEWEYQSVRVWDFTSAPIRKRKLARPLSFRQCSVPFATSPDGAQLARMVLTRTGSPSVGTVEVWDLTYNPVETRRFEVPGEWGYGNLRFSPDGKKLAVYGPSIIISDLTSNPLQQRSIFEEAGLPPKDVEQVTFSHDGNQLASNQLASKTSDGMIKPSDGMITLWDLTFNPVQTKVIERHGSFIVALALSPRSEQLALITSDGWLELWDLTSSTSAKPGKFRFNTYVQHLSFSPTGKYLNTNRGQLPLPSNGTHDSSNISPLLFVKQSWVSKDGENILWLPVEHRSDYVAVHENIARWVSGVHEDIFGRTSVSGQMILIKFDFSKPFSW